MVTTDDHGVIIDGDPPAAIDIDPAEIAPPATSTSGVAMPEVERLQVVEVRPGDTVVATVPADTNPAEATDLCDGLAARWPDTRVVVLAGAIELAVYRPGER